MDFNDRKSDRTHLNLLLTEISLLIPNLKSDFQKNRKNQKTRSVYFVPNQIKIFFSNPAPSN